MDRTATKHDSLEDAIWSVLAACGGPKVVACKLWPEKDPGAAHRLLLACLNEDRQERLSPGHLMLIMKEGRRKSCHSAMEYFAAECGYKVKRVKREDRREKLIRQRAEAAGKLAEAELALSDLDSEPATIMRVVGE
ncbi:MAG: hypothetical protein ACRBC3_19775 [Burkholderiaceae bacterium]